MKKRIYIAGILLLSTTFFASAQQPKSEKLTKIEQALKADAPKILCLNEAYATAGQPKIAAHKQTR